MPDAAVVDEHDYSEETQVLSFGAGWSARIFTSWRLPGCVLRSWETLARQYGDRGVFLESGWFELWASTIGRNNRLFVVVVEHDGEVRGIFPCGLAPTSRVQTLAFDLPYDFLVSSDAADLTLDCFLEVLVGAAPAGAYFHDIPASSAVAPLFEKRLRIRRMPVGRYSRPSAPHIDLRSGSWQDYVSGLHPKLRNNLKKGHRRAAREGDLSFHVITRPVSLDTVMDEVLDVESRSWKGEQGTAIKCDHDNERFYRSMASRAMDQGRLHIFALRLNDRMIAFDLCNASGKTMFAIKTGYDQEFAARFSPGNLMRYRVLEYLFRTPAFNRYDFLGPAYPWKLEWTSQTDTWTSFEVYPATLRGWYGYLRKYGWKRPLQRSEWLVALLKRLRGRP